MLSPENDPQDTANTDAEAGASDGQVGAEGEQPKPASKLGNKKIIAMVVVLLLIIGGGVGAFMFLKSQKAKEEAAALAEKDKQAALPQNAFVDMDEIIVNLNTDGKAVSFMKVKITLEVADAADVAVVNKLMPRIRDVLQVYMRELRPADMQGSVGLYRLKEELLYRINKLVYPAKVSDLLFKDVLIQ
jgi:flagellar FliL protein